MNTQRTLVAAAVSVAVLAAVPVWGKSQNIEEESDSVYRWGRWAVLSPAAGGEETRAIQRDTGNDLRPGEAGENTPDLIAVLRPQPPEDELPLPFEPDVPDEIEDIADGDDDPLLPPDEPPVDPPVDPPIDPPVDPPDDPVITGFCEAGQACGFATLYGHERGEPGPRPTRDGDGGDGNHRNCGVPAELARFDLSRDGSSFEISAEDLQTILSVLMNVHINGPGFLHGNGVEDGDHSKIWAHVDLDALEEILMATGDWAHNKDHGDFVWGIAATLEEMEALAAGDVIALYRGQSEGWGALTKFRLDFGEASWSARIGPGGPYRFRVSGDISGPNLNAVGYSPNINTDASNFAGFVMQGAQNLGAGWEVENVDGQGYVDVVNAGLLRSKSGAGQ